MEKHIKYDEKKKKKERYYVLNFSRKVKKKRKKFYPRFKIFLEKKIIYPLYKIRK